MEQERLKSVQLVDHRNSEYSGSFELVIQFEKSGCYCKAFEGLEVSDICDSITWTGGMGKKSDKEPLVRDIVRDLVSLCNQDGRTFHYDQAGADRFAQRWEMKAFRDMVDGYGLTKKLPLDRAIQVLQEYYIVEPIMES